MTKKKKKRNDYNSSVKLSLSTTWILKSKISQFNATLLRRNMEWCSSRIEISVLLKAPLDAEVWDFSAPLSNKDFVEVADFLFFFTSIHRSKLVHGASVHMPIWHNTSALPTLIPIKRSCRSYSAMAAHGKVRNRSCLLSVDTHLCFYASILCTNILFLSFLSFWEI